MIYATNSVRAINSYCADIYEENNIIDSYFYSSNNGYFKPLNEGNVLTTIIEDIKAAFNFIKKKFTELWGKILGLIKTIKEKIHKKKTNTSDNNSNNQDTVKKLSEEDKKKLEEYILKKTQLAKMNKLDLNKVNDKRKILNDISSQMESWNNSLKSIDDFNSKDQYIEYYKTQLYELIDKLFDKKIKIDTDETLEQIYLKIREYLNDNFKIVDTNGEILPEYRKSLLFKLEDLQKYKDELTKQIDEYDKDLQKCAVSISKFIQQSNDRINKLANDCVKNGMNENEAKSVTSEATKNTNGLATIASDISKVAAQNTAALGNIVNKIDNEVDKAIEESKAKTSSDSYETDRGGKNLEINKNDVAKLLKEKNVGYTKLINIYTGQCILRIFRKLTGGTASVYSAIPEFIREYRSNVEYIKTLFLANFKNENEDVIDISITKILYDYLPQIHPKIKKDSKSLYKKNRNKILNYYNNQIDPQRQIHNNDTNLKKYEKEIFGFVVEAFDNICDFDNIHFLNE